MAVTVTAEDEREAAEEAASEVAGTNMAAPSPEAEVPVEPTEAVGEIVASPLEAGLPEAVPQETEIESKTEAAPPGPTEETNDEA